MKTIILDFSECKYASEIHKVIKKAFSFPDYYGANLSALWDCLDYYCNYDLTVDVRGFNLLPEEFNDYKIKILEIFNGVSENSPNIIFKITS